MRTCLVTLALVSALTMSQAAVVTLTVKKPAWRSETLDVPEGQVATLLAMEVSSGSGAWVRLNVQYPGMSEGLYFENPKNFVLVGPVKVFLSGVNSPGLGFASFDVRANTDMSSPGGTLVVAGGTQGAKVLMEASPDLINWTNAVPGTYTTAGTGHLFFRIRAEHAR